MDFKPLTICNSSKPSQFIKTFKEAQPTVLNNSSNVNCEMFSIFSNLIGKPDALEAVKLDPAVLEAQVTVHENTKDNRKDTSRHFEVKNKRDKEQSQSIKTFEQMISQQEAALLSLTPHQLELLMKYVDMLRRQRTITQRYLECAFCKNNGRPACWYMSHVLKDGRGRILCPVLRRYRCPKCGASGDFAHTIKYCPENSFIDSMSSCSGNLF